MFDFYKVPVEPPHIEDLGFDPKSIVYKGLCTDSEWEKVLRDSSFSTVDAIYDGLLKERRWIEADVSPRSLGTVSKIQIETIEFEPLRIPGHYKPRLTFRDSIGLISGIPVSDLSFRTFADSEIRRLGSTSVASVQILKILRNANRLYLRIGLPGKWVLPHRTACWTQVTGIHTFPDYLKGKSFADFLD